MLWGVTLLWGDALGSYFALRSCSGEIKFSLGSYSGELLWGGKCCFGEANVMLWRVALGGYFALGR